MDRTINKLLVRIVPIRKRAQFQRAVSIGTDKLSVEEHVAWWWERNKKKGKNSEEEREEIEPRSLDDEEGRVRLDAVRISHTDQLPRGAGEEQQMR